MIRKSSVPVTKSTLPRAPYCLIGWFMATAALIIAAGLLINVFFSMSAAGKQAANAQPLPVTMIFLSDEGQQPERYRLIQAGLLTSGFRVISHPLPADATSAARGALQEAVSQQAANGKVWLVCDGSAAAFTWQLAGQLTKVTGIILIAPENLDEISDFAIRQWEADRFCLLLSSMETSAASRSFYELISGEDATLFPPYQASPVKPLQYASANGQTWLMDYPALTSEWALISARLLPDLTGWLEDWAAGYAAAAGPESQSAGRLAALIFQLAAAGLMLMAVPAGLSLAMAGSPQLIVHPENPEPPAMPVSALRLIASGLLWVPAAIIALAMGMALAFFHGQKNDWLLPGLLLLPGCRGALSFLGQMVSRKRHQTQDDDDFDQDQRPRMPPMLPSRVAGLIMLLAGLTLAVIWIWLSFGSLMPSKVPAFWLSILFLISLPTGFSGSPGQIGIALNNGLSPILRWHHSIVNHLPYIVMVVCALPIAGTPGLTAAILLLAVSLWSAVIGKAATLLTLRPWVGSLLQAAAWTTAILLPPLTRGL